MPTGDSGVRPDRDDGIRRTATATTGLLAVGAAAVIGFGVLAREHTAAGGAGSIGTGDGTTAGSTQDDGSAAGDDSASTRGDGSGSGLVSSGGSGRAHASSGGS